MGSYHHKNHPRLADAYGRSRRWIQLSKPVCVRFNCRITKIVNMRKQAASLKVIISLGGSQFRWSYISTMMRSPENRHTFIESSMAYIQKRQLDGLHLDFYFPQDAIDSSSDDRQGFIRLIQVREVCSSLARPGKRRAHATHDIYMWWKMSRKKFGKAHTHSIAFRYTNQNWRSDLVEFHNTSKIEY